MKQLLRVNFSNVPLSLQASAQVSRERRDIGIDGLALVPPSLAPCIGLMVCDLMQRHHVEIEKFSRFC